MNSPDFWTTIYREKNPTNFQTFPNRHKRTWCSRSNIMGLPPFDNIRLYSYLSAVKNPEKKPCQQDLLSYHNAAHISPYCALLPYHKSGDTLWMWVHIYSSITGSRFWPLAAFFRLFSVYSSICAISKEKKKSWYCHERSTSAAKSVRAQFLITSKLLDKTDCFIDLIQLWHLNDSDGKDTSFKISLLHLKKFKKAARNVLWETAVNEKQNFNR